MNRRFAQEIALLDHKIQICLTQRYCGLRVALVCSYILEENLLQWSLYVATEF